MLYIERIKKKDTNINTLFFKSHLNNNKLRRRRNMKNKIL